MDITTSEATTQGVEIVPTIGTIAHICQTERLGEYESALTWYRRRIALITAATERRNGDEIHIGPWQGRLCDKDGRLTAEITRDAEISRDKSYARPPWRQRCIDPADCLSDEAAHHYAYALMRAAIWAELELYRRYLVTELHLWLCHITDEDGA